MTADFTTLMAQLRRDFLVHGERDGQAIFDALGAHEKELLWIEESNQRFYAYNHFGQHPEGLVGWFDEHMKGTGDDRKSGGEKRAVAYRRSAGPGSTPRRRVRGHAA